MLQEVDKHVSYWERWDAADNAAGWREAAKGMTKDGGRVAHAFAKGPAVADAAICHAGEEPASLEALGGDDALAALEAEWMPIWRARPKTEVEEWPDDEAALPPCTVEQLRGLLGLYARWAGLGWDALHPRQLAYLPGVFLQVFLGILAKWEGSPRKLHHFLTKMIFINKPTGGKRPIGLTCLWMRLYSRLRADIARQWEITNAEKFFIGIGSNTCERAGWTYSVNTAYAKATGLDVGGSLIDLRKFYEYVCHNVLLRQAKGHGI